VRRRPLVFGNCQRSIERACLWGTAFDHYGSAGGGSRTEGGGRGYWWGGGSGHSLGAHRRVGPGMLVGPLPNELLGRTVLLSQKVGTGFQRVLHASTLTHPTARAVGAGPPSAFPNGKAAKSLPEKFALSTGCIAQRLPITCTHLEADVARHMSGSAPAHRPTLLAESGRPRGVGCCWVPLGGLGPLKFSWGAQAVSHLRPVESPALHPERATLPELALGAIPLLPCTRDLRLPP
jgi:hypothetical protein